jgi:hypothetical protein
MATWERKPVDFRPIIFCGTTVVAVLLCGYGGHLIWRAKSVSDWPVTHGHITESQVVQSGHKPETQLFELCSRIRSRTKSTAQISIESAPRDSRCRSLRLNRESSRTKSDRRFRSRTTLRTLRTPHSNQEVATTEPCFAYWECSCWCSAAPWPTPHGYFDCCVGCWVWGPDPTIE